MLLLFDLDISAQRVFPSMHLADGFIQRANFYQFMHVNFLEIEPMILRFLWLMFEFQENT